MAEEQVSRLRGLTQQLLSEDARKEACQQSQKLVENQFWANIATPSLLQEVQIVLLIKINLLIFYFLFQKCSFAQGNCQNQNAFV